MRRSRTGWSARWRDEHRAPGVPALSRAFRPRRVHRLDAGQSLLSPSLGHRPQDDERFAAYLSDSHRDDFEAMLVCRREDLAIVGFFNLSQIARGSLQSAYLGYAVGKPFAGHGYMRDGIQLVLRHAFLNLRLHRIEANIQPGNRASIALASGAGFRREGFSPRYLKIGGRWRDHERWAILAEDWRERSVGLQDAHRPPID